MSKPVFRKVLSAPGLLRLVRRSFSRIDDPIAGRGLNLADCLMSGLAVFGLKYPSLLSFERDARQTGAIGANLKSLYGVRRAPSDTRLRERLDEVDPRSLRGAFKAVFAALQRGKGLEGFDWMGHYLLSERRGRVCGEPVLQGNTWPRNPSGTAPAGIAPPANRPTSPDHPHPGSTSTLNALAGMAVATTILI